jgi:hypothetical protein
MNLLFHRSFCTSKEYRQIYNFIPEMLLLLTEYMQIYLLIPEMLLLLKDSF